MKPFACIATISSIARAHWSALPVGVRALLGWLAPYLVLIASRQLLDRHWTPGRILFSVLLFWFFAAVLSRWPAVLAALSLEKILQLITRTKQNLTGEPLLASDLLQVSQSSALTGYVSPFMYLYAALFLVAIIWGSRWLWKRISPGPRPHYTLLASVLPAMILLMHFESGLPLRQALLNGLKTMGIKKADWDYATIISHNGILPHLFLSAEASPPPSYSPHQFYARQAEFSLAASQPDIVVILCEGCFTSFDQRLPTAMRELEQDHFQPLWLLSPVYGGGTAEAEYEILTGLSASALPGVDYQDFVRDFRLNARTLVRRFDEAGYHTIGMHNFVSTFWKRNEIYPRFGFAETRFLENMGDAQYSDWPSDKLLFDHALSSYSQLPAVQPAFLFLITVHTHGPFREHGGDGGLADYRQRLAESIGQMRSFVHQMDRIAAQRGRRMAVVVFGDHKPAINTAFEQAGILNPGLQEKSKEQLVPPEWLARFRSSAYIRLPNEQENTQLVQRLNDRPMFCLSAELASLVPGKDDAFWKGVLARCAEPLDDLISLNREQWQHLFPPGLYHERLF